MNETPTIHNSVAITIIGGLLLILIRSGLLNAILRRLLGGGNGRSPSLPSIPGLPTGVVPDPGDETGLLKKWLEQRKARRDRRRQEEVEETNANKLILDALQDLEEKRS